MPIDDSNEDPDSSPTKRYSCKPAKNVMKENIKSVDPSAMSSLS